MKSLEWLALLFLSMGFWGFFAEEISPYQKPVSVLFFLVGLGIGKQSGMEKTPDPLDAANTGLNRKERKKKY